MNYNQSHLEKKGEQYDQALNEGGLNQFMSIKEALIVKDLVNKLKFTGNPRYLDFACGSGRILSLVAPFFNDVVAVDVSENMVQAAREKVPSAKFHLANITSQELDIGQFDLITAFRFFGNAEDSLRNSVLNALRSHIKEDGYLLINNHRNPKSLLSRISGDKGNMDLDYKKLPNILATNGFTIIRKIPIGTWFLRNSWLKQEIWEHPLGKFADLITRIPALAPISPDMVILAQPIK